MSYFDWLCMVAVPDGYHRLEYSMLLNTLMETEFYWLVPRDENRARDGLELRDLYEQETGETCDFDGPCTVLEMMLALAMRCNDEIMYDPEDPNRADQWFWTMICNLKVDVFDNKHFSKIDTEEILEKFLDRKYENFGQGVCFCLFPPPKLSTNFYRSELWYQLNWWIMRHFGGYFA